MLAAMLDYMLLLFIYECLLIAYAAHDALIITFFSLLSLTPLSPAAI